jgi:hypothetical protein
MPAPTIATLRATPAALEHAAEKHVLGLDPRMDHTRIKSEERLFGEQHAQLLGIDHVHAFRLINQNAS